MRIVVAGGAGFIGSNLIGRLLDQKAEHKIILIDNFCTGSKRNLWRSADVEVIEHDICNAFSEFSFSKIDQIYNLACPASPVAYQNMPVETTLTSVVGTCNLLRLAQDHKARFFQASTSEVYGDPTVHPQTEEYWGRVNSYGPRACYDEGKRAAEAILYDCHHKYGVDVRMARIFNTYGPNMAIDDGRVVSNFLVQAIKGEDITIYGDGSQTRSFCYVDDMIDGILTLMEQPFNGPVNLGNPHERTMKELAKHCLTVTNSSSKIVYKPLPIDDPLQRCPDISKAKALGWFGPKITLNDGLIKTAKYFQMVLNHEPTNQTN
jgi:UDP-glucuronate decarboxylase